MREIVAPENRDLLTNNLSKSYLRWLILYCISGPTRKIEKRSIADGQTVRVALFSSSVDSSTDTESSKASTEKARESLAPPVCEGELIEIEITSVGDKGDGIAKVERGDVLIVPRTDRDDTVSIEIEDVQDDLAFATVIDHPSETS